MTHIVARSPFGDRVGSSDRAAVHQAGAIGVKGRKDSVP